MAMHRLECDKNGIDGMRLDTLGSRLGVLRIGPRGVGR